jgi:hypothetical protein
MSGLAGSKTGGILSEEEEESAVMTLPRARTFFMALPSYHGGKKLQPIVVVVSCKWLFEIRLCRANGSVAAPCLRTKGFKERRFFGGGETRTRLP